MTKTKSLPCAKGGGKRRRATGDGGIVKVKDTVEQSLSQMRLRHLTAPFTQGRLSEFSATLKHREAKAAIKINQQISNKH